MCYIYYFIGIEHLRVRIECWQERRAKTDQFRTLTKQLDQIELKKNQNSYKSSATKHYYVVLVSKGRRKIR